eukprot:PhF_6_TR30693/c0_g1_i2/m.45160
MENQQESSSVQESVEALINPILQGSFDNSREFVTAVSSAASKGFVHPKTFSALRVLYEKGPLVIKGLVLRTLPGIAAADRTEDGLVVKESIQFLVSVQTPEVAGPIKQALNAIVRSNPRASFVELGNGMRSNSFVMEFVSQCVNDSTLPKSHQGEMFQGLAPHLMYLSTLDFNRFWSAFTALPAMHTKEGGQILYDFICTEVQQDVCPAEAQEEDLTHALGLLQLLNPIMSRHHEHRPVESGKLLPYVVALCERCDGLGFDETNELRFSFLNVVRNVVGCIPNDSRKDAFTVINGFLKKMFEVPKAEEGHEGSSRNRVLTSLCSALDIYGTFRGAVEDVDIEGSVNTIVEELRVLLGKAEAQKTALRRGPKAPQDAFEVLENTIKLLSRTVRQFGGKTGKRKTEE